MVQLNIYVDRNVVASNKKHNRNLPAIKVRRGNRAYAGHEVRCTGPITFTTDDKPNPAAGGATVWAFTTDPVIVTRRSETNDPKDPKAETFIIHPDSPDPETI